MGLKKKVLKRLSFKNEINSLYNLNPHSSLCSSGPSYFSPDSSYVKVLWLLCMLLVFFFYPQSSSERASCGVDDRDLL